MGTFSQGHILQPSGLLPPATRRSSVRSSLKMSASASSSQSNAPRQAPAAATAAPAGQSQVRWPMNLDQLAAISLDDDSDIDHSFNEGSTHDMRPINLLRMLKDSDDESSSNPSSSAGAARRTLHTRPKSMHALTASSTSNLHTSLGAGSGGPSLSGIPKPSMTRPRARSQSTSEPHPLRHLQLDGSLSTTRLQQQQQQKQPTGIQKPSSMSAAGVGPKRSSIGTVAQTGGKDLKSGAPSSSISRPTATTTLPTTATVIRPAPTLAKPRVVAARHTSIKVVQGTSAAGAGAGTTVVAKGKAKSSSLLPNSSSVTNLSRASSASSRIPGSSKPGSKTSSPSSSISQPMQLLQQQQQKRSSSAVASAKSKELQRKSSMPTPVTRSRQTSSTSLSPMNKANTLNKQPSSPSSPLQQQTSAFNNRSLKKPSAASQPALDPTLNMASTGSQDIGNQWSTHELIQELERWKAEAHAFKAERAATESWQQQYLILQRDLDAALDSLQAAEERAHRAESNVRVIEEELHGAVAARDDHAMMLEELTVARESREQVLETMQDNHRQLIEEQAAKIAQLEVENDDLHEKLDKAQQEMDQLVEAQNVPLDVQEIQDQLTVAAHELERVKADHSKVLQALEAEKEKVVMEQADAGHLLSKLSRLQDINANLIRDNNVLKERMLEHETCLDREQATATKHLKQVEMLQGEIRSLQNKLLDQEHEHKQAFERTLQDHDRQCMQLQQQVQIQQVQLQQQQSEIATLRASVEVERQQNQLWLQHQQQQLQMARGHQAAAAVVGDLSFNNGNSSFTGRRPSVDGGNGDLAGLTHFADTSANGSMAMGFDGLPPVPINTSKASSIVNRSMDGSFTPLPSSNADMSASSITGIPQSDMNPRVLHRSNSGSIANMPATSTSSNRLSVHGDIMATQSLEELTTQLECLMKEKERLQAELSKIPLSGGGPMTRRKVEMLEEQMDETDRTMSKIRYSIRMRS